MKQNSDQTVQNNQFSDQLLSIPTKICDGVFMADELISQDVQWLQMNQVTHIINCAGKHCKNTNRINGVNFLTYEWSQNNIQNIIEQNVIGAAISFIQQAKKQCGSVLVHCYQSESRPFCILASYLMIRYQWNLFKTLEFLNSRKQDIQLQPAFFQQLTSLHQKLQQKGLIKSRTWNRQEQMSDEELILTNTFLNSRKRAQQNANVTGKQAKTKKNEAKGKKVLWKESTSQIYVYYPLTPLIQLNPKINSKQNQKALKDATQTTQCQSRYTEEDSNSFKIQQTQSQQPKQNAKQSKAITQVNVTKRWAQLRQSWTKEKQNNQQLQNQPQPKVICTYYYNSENSRKVEKPLSNFNQPRQQKISDRIQDKLNIIRNGYEVKSASNDIMKRRDHTPITGKKIKSNTQNSISVKRQGQGTQRVSLIQKKKTQEDHEMSSGENSKDNQRQPFYEFNRNSSTVNSKNTSKIMKNNFTKANFGMNDSRATNEAVNQSNPVTNASMIISQVKQMGNKSVLIVKPNQFGQNMSSDSVSRQARNSKRKISDNDKQNRFSLNKDTSLMRQTSGNEPMRNSKVSNFFRVDNQQLGNMKNQSQNERMAKRIENNAICGSRVSDSLQTNKTSSSLTKKASSSTSVMTKMRSSSTRVSRKQDVGVSNLSISKNYSYTGKGKWKF